MIQRAEKEVFGHSLTRIQSLLRLSNLNGLKSLTEVEQVRPGRYSSQLQLKLSPQPNSQLQLSPGSEIVGWLVGWLVRPSVTKSYDTSRR